MLDAHRWLEQLVEDGFVMRTPCGVRLTKRWKVALARVTVDLARRGVAMSDMRTPIAQILVETYPEASEPSVVVAVGALLPLVIDELTYVAAVSPTNAKMD